MKNKISTSIHRGHVGADLCVCPDLGWAKSDADRARYRTRAGEHIGSPLQRWIFFLFLLLFSGCATMGTGEGAEGSQGHQAQITVTGSGGKTTGPLEITRIELNFSNDLGSITVPMNSTLRPYAVIRFDGNGLFRAVWEVDGRPLETVASTVTFGNTLTVRTGTDMILPTFEPGPHSLTLRVEEPVPGFELPVIRYFVTGEKK